MKTKEQKALEIAIAEGWEKLEGSNGLENDYWKNKQTLLIQSTSDVIELYTIFGDKRGNGLMPIVERINTNARDNGDIMIEVSLYFVNIYRYSKTTGKLKSEKYFRLANSSLLDTLLDAVHYVLCENKEK